MQEDRPTQARDRQSIWSVPGHLWPWYIVIFVCQYFLFLGLTIWNEVVSRGGSDAIEVILNVQKGMTASILNMAASTYVILEGVMLAQWLRDRDRQKQREAFDDGLAVGREEGIEVGREEGIEVGREETNQDWQAWYQRLRAAQSEGLPFDEPPPNGRDPEGKQ